MNLLRRQFLHLAASAALCEPSRALPGRKPSGVPYRGGPCFPICSPEVMLPLSGVYEVAGKVPAPERLVRTSGHSPRTV
jgi:hypothetical protein